MRPRVLGRLLVESGSVSESDVRLALETQAAEGGRLGEVLVRTGRSTEEAVARALATQLGLAFLPGPLLPDPAACRLLDPALARRYRVVPIGLADGAIEVALSDPLDGRPLDDLRFATGRRIVARVSTPLAVRSALGGLSEGEVVDLAAALPGDDPGAGPDVDRLEDAIRSAPVVRVVDHILRRAAEVGASDIHVEETGTDVRVRFRLDGTLRRALDLPGSARRAVLSRLKVMAGLDISVRRRPQDGRFRVEHAGRRLTVRLSTLPVLGGEKAVARLLDGDTAPPSLDGLGLAPTDAASVRRMLAAGEGVVLATGPTGSGKSTTLFAALGELEREQVNIVTLEDPVEYRVPWANQVQVDARGGLGFAAALRAVLRQDPDVVMVGEIRDRETAEIAMSAAVTGHLVFSSLHTIDATGAVSRLLHMGVPPFLVAGGLRGVVAQRLVRAVCPACRGRGCSDCFDGYRGRAGVFQVLEMTDPLRDAVASGAGSTRLRRLARDSGMATLADDARRVLAEGRTTPHEIRRILSADPASGRLCGSCGAPVPPGATACPGCGRMRMRRCGCGAWLEDGWRYCPACVRPIPLLEATAQ